MVVKKETTVRPRPIVASKAPKAVEPAVDVDPSDPEDESEEEDVADEDYEQAAADKEKPPVRVSTRTKVRFHFRLRQIFETDLFDSI